MSAVKLSMLGTTSLDSRFSLLLAPHVPNVNDPCNLVASPSTRCTMTPGSARAEQAPSDRSPHGNSYRS